IKLDAAKLGVETARSQLKSNDDQLQQLTVNRQMADFIKARHQSTDYTRLLGTIARARSDFEKLSHLLASERDLGHKPGANLPGQPTAVDPLLPRIDRIVLYIDDLDRCPERKVVEVLQAVHLLLAFPLFVVVVGVDSRWLLHSLKQHSRAFRGLPADIQSHPEDAHWQSTPLNYLEKIFQIPFTLWPMEKEGFGNLIESLVTQQGARQGGDAEDKRQAGRERTEQDEAEKSRAASVGGSASRVTTPTRTSGNPDPVKSTGDTGMHQYGSQGETQTAVNSEKQTSQEQSQDLAPEHLLIEEWERDFMKRLYGFIPSPRSAKRFVNIYRILRAWVKDHEVEAFKGDKNGGGHRAALLLLAILIGYPDEATEVLGRLLDVDEKISWWGFIEDLKREFAARVPAGIKPEGIKGAQPDEVQTDEPQKDEPQKYAPARWEEFIEKLEKTRAMRPSLIAEGQPCKDFKTWAPRVARYSFQSGRVLLTQMIGDASEQTNIRPPRLK
ncbi:MAG TPA: P-loop NTPase fold protein, partial [Blastocatellia bacterium]|nr:P-loop NTPase fold protein [Blastocatellia bacterium]